MSVEAISTVLHHSRATGTAKVVLIGIANHAGDGGAWPTIATLAKYAGVTDRNVQIAIRKLEELGEIRVHVQAGGTRHTQDRYRSNRYDILVSCPADCDRSTSHRCASDDPEDHSEEISEDPTDRGDVFVTPHAQAGVTESTPLNTGRGVDSDTSGVSPATPEPSYNHPDTPQPPASGGPTPSTCSKPGPTPHRNCRGCGTTNRQLAEARARDLDAQRRADDHAALLAARRDKQQRRAQGPSAESLAALEQLRAKLVGAR